MWFSSFKKLDILYKSENKYLGFKTPYHFGWTGFIYFPGDATIRSMRNAGWGPWGHGGCVFPVCPCCAKKLLSKAKAAEENALKKGGSCEFMRITS